MWHELHTSLYILLLPNITIFLPCSSKLTVKELAGFDLKGSHTELPTAAWEILFSHRLIFVVYLETLVNIIMYFF